MLIRLSSYDGTGTQSHLRVTQSLFILISTYMMGRLWLHSLNIVSRRITPDLSIIGYPSLKRSLSRPFSVMAAHSLLGSLSSFESYDNTPHIGTTFPDRSVQLARLLTANNSDELIKDLATLVSHRGVVFFTDQDIGIEQQKELANRLGELSGKPATSKLHRHPISEDTPELGADVSVISSTGYVYITCLIISSTAYIEGQWNCETRRIGNKHTSQQWLAFRHFV